MTVLHLTAFGIISIWAKSKWVRRISQGNFKTQHLAAAAAAVFVAKKFVFPTPHGFSSANCSAGHLFEAN